MKSSTILLSIAIVYSEEKVKTNSRVVMYLQCYTYTNENHQASKDCGTLCQDKPKKKTQNMYCVCYIMVINKLKVQRMNETY